MRICVSAPADQWSVILGLGTWTACFSARETELGTIDEPMRKRPKVQTVTNNSDPQIRRLEIVDSALYRNIRLEALKQNPEAFGSTFEMESEKPPSWFETTLSRTDIFGAFLEGTLAGMAGFVAQESSKRAHKGVLWGMYVRPAARNSGLGRRLVESVLIHARERVEAIQLTVISENEAAHGLYRALGFVEYGLETRALKQNGRYYDEVLMVKFLDQNLN
jgi:ribosomal protein S18 acetylase RimI-like enzyme